MVFLQKHCINIIIKNNIMGQDDITLLTEDFLWSKVHVIRGVQVMLDFDLAAIYGYETKRFNEQVKNNIERFDESFRFQLTDSEFQTLRSKFSTSSWGGKRYNPYAFTEEGIYMLMTVLKGDLAASQSKKLIKLFKQMKNFIIQNQNLLVGPELFKLSMQTKSNTEDINKLKHQVRNQVVSRDELMVVIKDFTDLNIRKDYLFYNGQMVEADIAYAQIYSLAKKTIHIVDNYISLKTLVLLKSVPSNVKVTIFSDNIGKNLHRTEFADYRREYPGVNIILKTTGGIYHDRYIFIDHNTPEQIIFHCGGSSKDSGGRITSISRIDDVMLYRNLINDLRKNPILKL